MQQFTIPQFIDVEDKIIGPITTRQFIIILIASIVSGVAYKLADFALFITITLVVFGIGGVFAFLKINGQNFHLFILNLVQTLKKPKIRIWNNRLGKTKSELNWKKEEEIKKIEVTPKKPVYPKSKLAELSLIVDTGGAYKGGGGNIKINTQM